MSIIYHLESQKLKPLHCNGQKTTRWIMITAALAVELPQDSYLRTRPNFVGQYRFPEIHKNHLAEAAKCPRTPDVLYHWQLQVLNVTMARK